MFFTFKTGKQIATPVESQKEAEDIAKSEKDDKALDGITATLTIEGNPMHESGRIITMEGVGQKYGGNYYITTIKHTLGSSFYKTVFTLKKNGTNKSNSDNKEKFSNESVNKTNGEDSTTGKKELKAIEYDVNSIEVNK